MLNKKSPFSLARAEGAAQLSADFVQVNVYISEPLAPWNASVPYSTVGIRPIENCEHRGENIRCRCRYNHSSAPSPAGRDFE